MKKFLAVICIVLSSIFCFTGCASVNYSMIMNTDGTIEQGLQVILDRDEIELAGYNYDDVKNRVIFFMESFEEYKNDVDIYNYARNYKHISFNSCGIICKFAPISDTNFYIGIKYNSSKIYSDYIKYKETLNPQEETEDEDLNEDYWLFIKDIDKSETIFNGLESKTVPIQVDFIHWNNYNFVTDLLNYFDGETNGDEQFTLEDVDYNFYYGMPTKKLYSDADEIIYKDGVKIHHWNFNASELDGEITTYSLLIRSVAWYVLALALTLILILGLVVTIFIRKKSKKIENTIVEEEK